MSGNKRKNEANTLFRPSDRPLTEYEEEQIAVLGIRRLAAHLDISASVIGPRVSSICSLAPALMRRGRLSGNAPGAGEASVNDERAGADGGAVFDSSADDSRRCGSIIFQSSNIATRRAIGWTPTSSTNLGKVVSDSVRAIREFRAFVDRNDLQYG